MTSRSGFDEADLVLDSSAVACTGVGSQPAGNMCSIGDQIFRSFHPRLASSSATLISMEGVLPVNG